MLPIEFSEVTITRTLWRSGDSEYAINGVPCRLLDVQELLSDSGVGRQQHVIVSQGQIDGVLNARPEDRRAIIEEAAGVLKYRKRKERAERRLDATEGNLVRVQDLLREVRRQLRPLERQAEAARRHGEVVGELTALRIHVAGRELAACSAWRVAVAGAAAAGGEERVGRRTRRLDTAVLAAEARLGRRGERRRRRARSGRAAARTGPWPVGGPARAASQPRRDRVQLMDASVAVSLEAEAARLRSELSAAADARRPSSRSCRRWRTRSGRGRRRATIEGGEGSDGGADGTRATRAAAEVRGELHARRTVRVHEADGSALLTRRIASLEEQERSLADRIAELDEQVDRASGRKDRWPPRPRPLAPRSSAVDAEIAAAEATHREAEARVTAWAARVDALVQALDAARAKAGAAHLEDVDGVLGPLLELVEIEPGWDAAVEAALGEALAAVVVADAGAARRALAHLHEARVHGGVLAPRTSTAPAPTEAFGAASRAGSCGRSCGRRIRGSVASSTTCWLARSS